MEWVETTGRTVEEAKEVALDRLGVDAAEAEFEVVEEPKAGLFGRMRREARVRARVQPTQPRPKVERRPRRGSGRKNGGAKNASSGRGGAGGDSKVAVADAADDGAPAEGQRRNGGGRSGGASSTRRGGSGGGRSRSAAPKEPTPNDRPTDGAPPARSAGRTGEGRDGGGPEMTEEVTLEQQGDMVEAFLDGLLDAFDLDGEVARELVDEEMLELRVEGDDLGLLIGPKGQTLAALQELSRTVVQRQAIGGHQGRFRLDVSGYRQRRREALERFTRSVADEVKASGVQKALEPMGSADRKVVHDTVNEIDGVVTVSEGEEPRRCVVILPE